MELKENILDIKIILNKKKIILEKKMSYKKEYNNFK